MGNPARGFDFKGSPFGEDDFDYFPFIRHGLRYQDVFTGFVFFKPLKEHRMSVGLPGLVDRAFLEKVTRCFALVGKKVTSEELEKLEKAEISGYEASDCAEKIERWLKPKTDK